MRLILHVVGTAFLLGSLIYLGAGIVRHWSSLRSTHISHPLWLLVAIVVYAISHITTGLAWPFALRAIGQPIALTEGLRIGLVAQIGKYLPGNIAHYVGRGALARTAGVPLRTSGLSTAVELVSALSAAVVVSLILAFIDPRPFPGVSSLSTTPMVFAATILLAALAFAAWLARRGHRMTLFAGPVACLTVSLMLSGFSFTALLGALGHGKAPMTLVIATVALAWVAGFLVPGAPAGLGIREAILLATLSPVVGAAATIAAAVLHRLITAAVDALAAVLGYAWMSRTLSKK